MHLQVEYTEKWFLTINYYLKNDYDVENSIYKIINKNKNVNMKTILKYRTYFWYWNVLTTNTNITFDIVKNNLEFNWDWSYISQYYKITIETIINNFNLPWDWKSVICNINLIADLLLHHSVKKTQHTSFFGKILKYIYRKNSTTKNNSITNSKIKENISYHNKKNNNDNYGKLHIKYLNWQYMCENKHDAFDYLYNQYGEKWDWIALFKHNLITLEIVLNNPNLNWNWELLSEHKNITMEMIQNNPKLNWDYYKISSNPNLTINFIKHNFNKNWCWYDISKNQNITMEMIINNENLPWSEHGLIHNPNLSIGFIFENSQYYYNHSEKSHIVIVKLLNNTPRLFINFSKNNHLTMNVINDNMNFEWRWFFISSNPNLTLKFIINNLDKKWDWRNICENNFDYDRNTYIKSNIKKILLTKILESKKNINKHIKK